MGANYVGLFDFNTTYQIDDCVYDDTDNDCCYCCVRATITQAKTSPIISTTMQTLFLNATAPLMCKDGQGYPSQLLGVNVGGGTWVPCNVNVLNGPCTPVISSPCDECNQTLVNDLPTPVTFPHNPIAGIFNYLGFSLGECIYDVDPTGTGDKCCWCCGCEFGLGPNGVCNEPPSVQAKQAATNIYNPIAKQMQPPPCFIDQISDLTDPSTGTFSTTSIYNTAWLPCGVTSQHTSCGLGGSSSISPISIIGL